MPSGSCFCGKCRFQYTGEAQAKALCHCTDCRKITGSAYSTNVIVPDTDFSLVSGSPKTIAKKADSGNDITSHFCGDCGTTLFRDGPSFPGAKIVKAGVLDDGQALEEARPAVELYAAQRVGWAKGVEGAAQLKGMPGSEAVA